MLALLTGGGNDGNGTGQSRNMKSVVRHRDFEGHPVWQKDYEPFMKTVGFQTKLCKVLQCQCAVIVHYCCAIEVGTKLVESQHRIVIADNDLAGGVICVSGTSDFHMQGNGFTHRHIGFIGFQPCIIPC